MDINLVAGTARGGHAEGDTIENVEVIWGSRHADTLTGGEGSTWLAGGSGDDLLTAGSGNENLTGGSGNDTLIGGAGNNWFRGDVGDDVFRFDADMPNGTDIISDFADDPFPTTGEQDVIELIGDLSFSSLVLTASGNDVVITTNDETGNVHITLRDYLVDHELNDLTAEDFAF